MRTETRTFVTAGAIGVLLALAGCSKADQQKTQADTNATAADVKSSTDKATNEVAAGAAKLGDDVKTSAKGAGDDLKAISKDPEVKKAAGELKGSLKDLGSALKDASRKHKAETNSTEAADAEKK